MGTTTPVSVRLKGTTGDINWSSTDSSMAKYENGEIIVCDSLSSSIATATITASASGCESKTCTVTVRKTLENAIDLGTDINGSGVTTDDWVLLYDGTGSEVATIGGYVYCILADYLPNTNSAIANSGLNAVSGKAYSVNIPDGSGNPNTLVASLNHSSAWTSLILNTYSNIAGTIVRGSITREEMNLIQEARDKKDYYLPEIHEGTNNYWLASRRLNVDNHIWCINSSGGVGSVFYNNTETGILPIVKIPANAITLNKVNGVWKITVNL